MLMKKTLYNKLSSEKNIIDKYFNKLNFNKPGTFNFKNDAAYLNITNFQPVCSWCFELCFFLIWHFLTCLYQSDTGKLTVRTMGSFHSASKR